MWIPYDLRGSLKTASAPETARLSLADTTAREFLVGFFLRNPVTQQWELDVIASATGEEIAEDDLAIRFFGNDDGKLSEIVVKLVAESASAALHRAHDALQRRLLRYVVETGRGMMIGGWQVADLAHSARWRCTPFRPSALTLDHAALPPVPEDLAPFAALFQRARNAPDAATRLMAATAVLYQARGEHPALSRCGAADFRVSREMLVHAGAVESAAGLLGEGLDALLSALRPLHNRLVGEGGIMAAIAGDLASEQELARMANLADLVAHRLLTAEIRARDAASAACTAEKETEGIGAC